MLFQRKKEWKEKKEETLRKQSVHYQEKVERRQLKKFSMHVSVSVNIVKLKDW